MRLGPGIREINLAALIRLTEIPDGFGRHIYIFAPDERVEKIRSWLKDLFVFEIFFHIATTLSKLAMYVLHSIPFLEIVTGQGNDIHQTPFLLPDFPHPSLQTPVCVRRNSFSVLHAIHRVRRDISMVPSFRISAATARANKSSHPIHYAWDRVDASTRGHCFNSDGLFIGSGSANVVLNFIIFVLVCSRGLFKLVVTDY